MNERIERTLAALKKNRMETYFVENSAQALELIERLCPEGSTVACGGSESLKQIGAIELFKSGKYTYLDRFIPGSNPEEEAHKAFHADVYFCSANAITEAGELYNVDGNGNRVAALTFGPESVIVVAGVNKLVPDMVAAVARVENIAAPLNAKRLSRKTPCAVTGKCEHCTSPERICCFYHRSAYQRVPGRIKVILVNEELGY